MDNIFEYLIYLFIIISFLSSFFKKKKTETKTGEQSPKPPLRTESQTRTSQQEDYDILKEIEKMFKTDSSYPDTERSIEKGEERFESSSEHLDTTDWHQPVISEHKYESWEEKNRKAEEKRKAVNEKIVKQAEMFERRLSGKRELQSEIKKTILQKFNNPKSLKEYIIFSEILGKPKSLQE